MTRILPLLVLVGCLTEPPTEPPTEIVLPSAAFTVQHGIAVAPIAVRAGTVVRGATIDVECPDAPHAAVLACIRAADPLNSSSAVAWCTALKECGTSPIALDVPMPDVIVGPRLTVQLVVASSLLASVEIGGALVVVD